MVKSAKSFREIFYTPNQTLPRNDRQKGADGKEIKSGLSGYDKIKIKQWERAALGSIGRCVCSGHPQN